MLEGSDEWWQPETEDLMPVLRPLFATSFLIDDFFGDNDFFGARTVILSSASSKTAYGLAFQLALRPGIKIVGLTSAPNVAFVESLGVYHQVVVYESLESQLPATAMALFVDMAGNTDVRARVHHLFQDLLKYSCGVGQTHWDSGGKIEGDMFDDDSTATNSMKSSSSLPGPDFKMFFAPSQSVKRLRELGAAKFGSAMSAAWTKFVGHAHHSNWCALERVDGAGQVADLYRTMIQNKADPTKGYLCSVPPFAGSNL
jgi:hypothetical protein